MFEQINKGERLSSKLSIVIARKWVTRDEVGWRVVNGNCVWWLSNSNKLRAWVVELERWLFMFSLDVEETSGFWAVVEIWLFPFTPNLWLISSEYRMFKPAILGNEISFAMKAFELAFLVVSEKSVSLEGFTVLDFLACSSWMLPS